MFHLTDVLGIIASFLAYPFAAITLLFIVVLIRACYHCCCGDEDDDVDVTTTALRQHVRVSVPLAHPQRQGRSQRVPRIPRSEHRNQGEVQPSYNHDKESVVVIDVEKLQEISKNCDDCVICLDSFVGEKDDDEYGGVKVLEQCGHKFHGFCIDEWLSKHRTCPLCRTCVRSNVFRTLREGVELV
uniref:RING-type domain-containing protein n=1 Tax=Chenopodium quinoa TaxID=63459 RepID=A0A803L791_CHEQI